MILSSFYNFIGRTFSEFRCKEEQNDPIEFKPGSAINLGYQWISLFRKLTVPPYAAMPKECRPPCKRRCCRFKKNPQPCNPICKRKGNNGGLKGCGNPCCYHKYSGKD